MGIFFSCPLPNYVEAVLVKSIHFADEEANTALRSVRFEDRDSRPVVMKSDGSNTALEASVTLRTTEPGMAGSVNAKPEEVQSPTSMDDAAVKLQKVYKSFRTRRKLADCAVLVQQQRWWEAIDYVELENSSISFFDEAKQETALSRWSRARTRAAKVGKGLSKNDKAQKLALQHWLEAIDPRHRYGHNLHFYYVEWLHSQSREPFFYWLDVGEGKEVNIVEKCPRCKLQQQCIKYLGPMERKAYEVCLEDGKLFYKQTGEPLHTMGEPGDVKWIFVLGTSKTMYVGRKKKGSFQHSSFLAGGAALAAGRLVVDNGTLKATWPHSGHYRPTEENFQDFLAFLRENDVDLTDVKCCPVEEEFSSTRSASFLRSNTSVEDLTGNFDAISENSSKGKRDSEEKETTTSASSGHPKPSRIQRFSETLTNLEIPGKDELIESLEIENPDLDSPMGGYEAVENALQEPVLKNNSNNPDQEPKPSPVGNQLPGKWTTGAGPRIKYVRDYPAEVQVRALEHVNLSPRRSGLSRSYFSPHNATRHSPVKLSSTTEPDYEPSSEGSIASRTKSSLSRRFYD